MDVIERIKAFRNKMDAYGIDVYIVPTSDFHNSEYVGEYFQGRKWLTGFTGSAGTCVITGSSADRPSEIALWTDGRYFTQAEEQLKGSGIRLMKIGEPETPEIEAYIMQALPEGGVLGFDGRVISLRKGFAYMDVCELKEATLCSVYDLIDEVWEDRPAMSSEPVWELGIEYAGLSREEKIESVRIEMESVCADYHIISSLDDICWLLNIRGNDVAYFPLVLCYAIVGMDEFWLYIDAGKLSNEIRADLEEAGITILPYNQIYDDVKTFTEDDCVMMDYREVNFEIGKNIEDEVECLDEINPSRLMKCVKNPVEIRNIREAELKDSIAHVRFMKWLKESVAKGEYVTEISATDKLDELRKEMGNFIQPSFDPIGAYASHSAVIHYSATPESNARLEPKGFFLTDTGAGFMEGSTDITRTYALGPVSEDAKKIFTIVAISNLRLAAAHFRYGCTGVALDILAREPMWERGLDFNHGTGHGVGYLLNIHEGPCAFRWRIIPGDTAVLEEGMVITDEPGLYFPGDYGIRLENEVLVKKAEKGEFGQFMELETLTYVPFDLDAIDSNLMTVRDKELLNDYHRKVYEKISPYLNEEECVWLAKYTRSI